MIFNRLDFVLITIVQLSTIKAQFGPLLISSNSGTYQGFVTVDGIRQWKGIPYARPPVGSLRFNPPQDMSPLPQIYNANFDAPGCIQNIQECADAGYKNFCPQAISEDCLYLNIFAPAQASSDPNGYPVMIWIHGGSLINGAGTVYDGTSFAQTGVIFVSINYRLGVLGYLATSTLKGNYGFLDQRKAMQWVVNNIKAFGGNPNKITLAGQSAGAMSVGAHMTSPDSQHLFQSAIMQSNVWYFEYHSRAKATETAQPIFDYVKCNIKDDNCMRNMPWQKLVEALDSLPLTLIPLSPVVELGGDIPKQPYVAFKNGEYPEHMRVLTGFTKDEGRVFVYSAYKTPMNADDYQKVLKDKIPPLMYTLYSILFDNLYPYQSSVIDGRSLLSDIFTDYAFACPLLSAASLASQSQAPIYMYEYTHAFDRPFNDLGGAYKYCNGYACHGMEIPFILSLLGKPAISNYQGSSDEYTFQTSMHNAWSNFVTTGNPNTGLALNIAPIVEYSYQRKITALNSGGSSSQTYYERNLKCFLIWDTVGLFGVYPS